MAIEMQKVKIQNTSNHNKTQNYTKITSDDKCTRNIHLA